MSDKNKESCNRWREKLKEDEAVLEDHKLKNRERMRNAREKWKALADGNDEMIQEKRKNDRIRKKRSRQKLAEMRNAEQSQKEPYKRQAFVEAAERMENALPKDLKKKIKSI